jgi:hypothetical protein
MYIAIRKEPNGSLYMDKYFFNRYNDSDLGRYNYTKAQVPDEYFEFVFVEDFDENLRFSEEKFKARLQHEEEMRKLPQLKLRLQELSDDIVQIQCGAVFEDKDERIAEFQQVHNEIRRILNKAPRIYLTSNK